MQVIVNWKAKRSGTGIRVVGQLSEGGEISLLFVEINRQRDPGSGPVATTADGTQYRLA